LQRIKYFRGEDSRWSGILESANKLDEAFGNKEAMFDELMHLKN
jgi:uncharacterized protein YdcH (DUF465 family)